MGATIDLSRGTLSCSELNFNFPLILDPPDKGLPDGVSLDISTNFVSPGVRSNLSAQLQYTAIDAVRPATGYSASSDNIVATDRFLKAMFLGPYLMLDPIDYRALPLYQRLTLE